VFFYCVVQCVVLFFLLYLFAKKLGLRATVDSLFVERGGCYGNRQGQNFRQAGANRDELHKDFAATHDVDRIHEQGWWSHMMPCDGEIGEEQQNEFQTRLQLAVQYVHQLAIDYYYAAVSTSTPPNSPLLRDHVLLVTHADFMNEFLCKLINLSADEHRAPFTFYSSNCCVSHIEIEARPNKQPYVRVRTINHKLTLVPPDNHYT